MIIARLTTIDNPHDPFEDFRAWFQFDTASGYNTTDYLARITFTSEEMSSVERNLANTQAIDEIIKENITGMYRKVTKEFPDDWLS